MRIGVWGARGSVPAPGPQMNRYGGNTSCVSVDVGDDEYLILDAGTGIRTLGLDLVEAKRINILLTHLHLDHIQGLMFFPPCFRSEAEIVIWGPSSPEISLEDRIARYISAPLSPVEVRELPCDVSFEETPRNEWRIGDATIRSAPVIHRGPTLGYRIEAGGESLCYIPDHEPAMCGPLASAEREWISGTDLALGADLLIHDCQYTDEEYPQHRGWGHSGLADALAFADLVDPRRLLLFHHDPLHSDEFLDELESSAAARWAELGHDSASVSLAREGERVDVAAGREPAAVA
ncbi:MBL fold metallo-hydrolase [Thermoleophilia bacterium SCSIO 60948]|nr:MBL fold metallo-hydrolase [Thermoleophilia bacterium SCSIO 60948]